jgi:hypothetical protein
MKTLARARLLATSLLAEGTAWTLDPLRPESVAQGIRTWRALTPPWSPASS